MNKAIQNPISKVLSTGIIAGFLGLFLFIGIEFFKYRGFFENHIGVPLWQLVLIYLVSLMFITLLGQTKLVPTFTDIVPNIRSSWLTKLIIWLMLPFAVFLFILLSGFEAYNFTNFVFSTFGVNLYALTELLLLSFFT